MYHEYIFYPFFTHSPLKIVKKVDVVEITECFICIYIGGQLPPASCREIFGEQSELINAKQYEKINLYLLNQNSPRLEVKLHWAGCPSWCHPGSGEPKLLHFW